MIRTIILGAGGHAQVVADILLRAHVAGGGFVPVGFLDDNPALEGTTILGLPVLGAINRLGQSDHDAVIAAIGDNRTRAQVFADILRRQGHVAQAIHPAAVIAPDVQLGRGVTVCAGVVVNTGTVIGDDVILNTGCTVDHHNRIGAHSHIAPGVHLGGEVTVGVGTLVGIGAVVSRGCSVGEWTTVGAGAAVIEDIPPHVTAVGVPARVIKRHPSPR